MVGARLGRVVTSVEPARVRALAMTTSAVVGALALAGAFTGGATGAICYVAALGVPALLLLTVSMHSPRHARAWAMVGGGFTLWTVAGMLVTLEYRAELSGIPDLLVSLLYVAGYVPCLVGVAAMADRDWTRRRRTGLIDGLLAFLVLYGVLWLVVVERYSLGTTLGQLDRAFGALYPAGDLALVMLTVRVAANRVMRRRVAVLLVVGSLLAAAADVLLLAFYLVDPDGSYPVTDLLYLTGLGAIALGAVWSLLDPPPPAAALGRTSRHLPVLVVGSIAVPPLLLLVIVALTDRRVSVVPVSLWLVAVVGLLVARNVAGVRELERVHEETQWVASHDLLTGALRRRAFLHEITQGSVRDRSGTVFVVEVQGLGDLGDEHGDDAVDHVLEAIVARLRVVIGDALLGRLAADRIVAFVRGADLGRGREAARALENALPAAVPFGDQIIRPVVCTGVAQADGAVIDASAGVRRATAALRHARRAGGSMLVFDADVTAGGS